MSNDLDLVKAFFEGKKIDLDASKMESKNTATPLSLDYLTTDYNADTSFVRNTELTHLDKSFLHWQAFKEGKIKQTEPMVRGIMLHEAILEPEKFYNSLVCKQDGRTKVGKEANALAIAEGKTLVSEKDFENIVGIAKTLLSNSFIANLLQHATLIEQPFLFKYGEFDFKIRPDLVSSLEVESDTIVDLKFVQDAEPQAMCYKAQKYGYDRQLSLYQIGAQAHGLPAKNCIIIAVEKEFPYAFSIIRLSNEVLFEGRTKLDTLLPKYKTALKMRENNEKFTSYNSEQIYEWEAQY